MATTPMATTPTLMATTTTLMATTPTLMATTPTLMATTTTLMATTTTLMATTTTLIAPTAPRKSRTEVTEVAEWDILTETHPPGAASPVGKHRSDRTKQLAKLSSPAMIVMAKGSVLGALKAWIFECDRALVTPNNKPPILAVIVDESFVSVVASTNPV